jgi:hypothetical protein
MEGNVINSLMPNAQAAVAEFETCHDPQYTLKGL